MPVRTRARRGLNHARAAVHILGPHGAAAHSPFLSLQAQYEASRARMARDGRRFRDAITLYEVEEQALKLRLKKLKEVS